MKQRSCNNCGAPLKHGYNRKCEYCGTLYDFNESNKIELHSYDLVDLKFRGLQRELHYSGVFLLYAYIFIYLSISLISIQLKSELNWGTI